MEKKFIPAKKYFAFTTRTTLNKIQSVAITEADKLIGNLEALQLEPIGPMEFIYFDCTADREKEFTLEIAMPVKEVKENIPVGYSFVTHEDFKCVSHVHKGELTKLHDVYEEIFSEIWNKSLKPTNQIREVYTKYFDTFSADNITEIQIGLQ
jgi:predicted transcriptional regulator YdeE